MSFLKSILLILVAVTFSYNGMSQQNHFIYLQTENKQPFYVKLDKKVISSSTSGYLIIPKLQDGDISLTVGFPKNEWPEQNINCNVNKKDAGYVLKNFGDKGWGLFNLQTLEVVMSGTKAKDISVVTEINKKDDFSNTLSNVVKDPSIAKEEIKAVPAPVIEVKQTEAKEPEIKQTEAKQQETTLAVAKRDTLSVKPDTFITKILSNSSKEGTDLIYVDIVNGVTDTVRVFIPVETSTSSKNESIVEPKIEPKAELKADTKYEPKKTEAKTESVVEIKPDEIKSDIKAQSKIEEIKIDTVTKPEVKKEENVDKSPKFIDITLPNPNAKADTSAITQGSPLVLTEKKAEAIVPITEKPKETVLKPVMMNSDCKAVASEDDFLKLRKKMAAENNDDDMIVIAKKAFKAKCFTTEQIKNLSVLFLKDEGKYKFFDAAYPFVTDSYNFGSLESQLNDNYFITRFKVMLRH